MSLPTINLTNQFGEESSNVVQGGTLPGAAPIANGTALANISGSAAEPAAVTLQALVNKEPAKTGVAALVALADPSTATTTQIATAYNALLAALKVVS